MRVKLQKSRKNDLNSKEISPEEIKEKIGYEEDLDDFIGFLDEKFKEWEKSRSRKKD